VAVLQFPSEPHKFRNLRAWARSQFQQELRLPALQKLGAEATDLGILIMACRRCGLPTSTLHVFEEPGHDVSQQHIETNLRRLWGTERCGWKDANCANCNARDELLYPVVAHYGRVLPESGRDLQLELLFGDSKVLRVDYHRMDPDGTATPASRPTDELAFHDVFQAPLSMRRFWNDFLTRHANAEAFVTRVVQPGYIVGVRPFTEYESEALEFYAGFERWMERRRRELAFDTVAFLRDLEDDEIPLAEEDTYHGWLKPFAPDITEALVDPFIVADSDSFVKVLDEVASRRGVRVARASGEDTLFVTLTAGEVEVRLNAAPRYFRILHTGATFHRGVIDHFAKEILAVKAAGDLPPVLRHRLRGYKVRVRDGKLLEVLDAVDRRLFCDDVVRVATAHAFHTIEGLEDLVRRMLPGVPLPFV